MTACRTMGSGVGRVQVRADDLAVREVRFLEPDDDAPDAGSSVVLDEAVRELRAYFAGDLRRFTVPAVPVGTPFQQRVWAALQEIPFGETRSYADLARQLGTPAAVRAVGGANGRNPVAILVPCHRVIGSDGTLTGYAGGLDRKRWLLAFERGPGLGLVQAPAAG